MEQSCAKEETVLIIEVNIFYEKKNEEKSVELVKKSSFVISLYEQLKSVNGKRESFLKSFL